MSDTNVLHLDEMLGQKNLKVDWKGAEYPLKTPTDLTPEEYMEVIGLAEKFVGYKDITNNKETSQDILRSVERMIQIIAPELAQQKIPFNGQMLVLAFWKEQQDDPAKKQPAKTE